MQGTATMVKDGVTKLEEFAALIHAHDLGYQYSDDSRVWARGDAQRQALLSLAVHLSRVEVEVIVDLTAKAYFAGHPAMATHYVDQFMAALDRRAA